MTGDQTDTDDGPDAPCPESSFKKIGEFFYTFSILEEWIRRYLNIYGGYSDDKLLSMAFKEHIDHWVKIANANNPNNPSVNQLYKALDDLRSKRNMISHAWWREREEQLYGSFTCKHSKEVMKISGDADLDKMISNARHCTAIIDFGGIGGHPTQLTIV
jgi:hypothetical protein